MLETVISNYLHFMRERQMVSHAFFCLDLPTYALCSVSTFLSYFQELATAMMTMDSSLFSFIHSQALIVQDGSLTSLSGFLDYTHTYTR
jgi:hypothetical protein